MSAKRNVWATIGKMLWTMLSFVVRIAARLGSSWARKKLDQHDRRTSGNRVTRRLRRHPRG